MFIMYARALKHTHTHTHMHTHIDKNICIHNHKTKIYHKSEWRKFLTALVAKQKKWWYGKSFPGRKVQEIFWCGEIWFSLPMPSRKRGKCTFKLIHLCTSLIAESTIQNAMLYDYCTYQFLHVLMMGVDMCVNVY